jgi:transposase
MSPPESLSWEDSVTGIYVNKKEQFRFGVICDYRIGKLTRREAAEAIQVSERTINRMSASVNEFGISGLSHKGRGRASHRKISDLEKQRVRFLIKEHYWDYNVLHCMEMLKERHKIDIGYETLRRWCHEWNCVKRRHRRPRKKKNLRDRLPAEGMLLQLDGSPHKYNGKNDWCLIAAIDDATSEIPYAQFFKSETTEASMKVVAEILRRKGVPRAIYTDRAGWSGGQKRTQFSQFVRACSELGVRVIFANSPEAKGRIERAFQTIQDRISPELRSRGITDIEAANKYLQNSFLTKYWNVRNTVKPHRNKSQYRAIPPKKVVAEAFCIKHSRVVQEGNTFYHDRHFHKFSSSRNMKGRTLKIHRYSNGKVSFWLDERKLKITKRFRPAKPLIPACERDIFT